MASGVGIISKSRPADIVELVPSEGEESAAPGNDAGEGEKGHSSAVGCQQPNPPAADR